MGSSLPVSVTAVLEAGEAGMHGQDLFRGGSPRNTSFSGIYFPFKDFLFYYLSLLLSLVCWMSVFPQPNLSFLPPLSSHPFCDEFIIFWNVKKMMVLPLLFTVYNLKDNPVTIWRDYYFWIPTLQWEVVICSFTNKGVFNVLHCHNCCGYDSEQNRQKALPSGSWQSSGWDRQQISWVKYVVC